MNITDERYENRYGLLTIHLKIICVVQVGPTLWFVKETLLSESSVR